MIMTMITTAIPIRIAIICTKTCLFSLVLKHFCARERKLALLPWDFSTSTSSWACQRWSQIAPRLFVAHLKNTINWQAINWTGRTSDFYRPCSPAKKALRPCRLPSRHYLAWCQRPRGEHQNKPDVWILNLEDQTSSTCAWASSILLFPVYAGLGGGWPVGFGADLKEFGLIYSLGTHKTGGLHLHKTGGLRRFRTRRVSLPFSWLGARDWSSFQR